MDDNYGCLVGVVFGFLFGIPIGIECTSLKKVVT